jgi:hypothetical protein
MYYTHVHVCVCVYIYIYVRVLYIFLNYMNTWRALLNTVMNLPVL